MNIADLKKNIKDEEPVYYGRKKINIIEIYEMFNLLDVAYEDDSTIFTIDIMTLKYSPSREIWIHLM